MKRLLVPVLAIAAAGCEPVPLGDPDYVSPDMQELRNNVLACLSDVNQVPLERSEHCVATAEGLFDLGRDDCAQNRSFECEAYRDEWARVATYYDRAVIASLVNHGTTPEAEQMLGSRQRLKALFHNPKPLRRLFNQCLADEERALREQGLIKVTSVARPLLKPGQRCFRKDYPEFRTKKAALS